MEELRRYLNRLTVTDQIAYAKRCGTTLGYLRKALSKKQRLGDALVVLLERESDGEVRCEDTRPDVDWAYIRSSCALGRGRGVERRTKAS